MSPVATSWPTLYAHVDMKAGATLRIPVEHTERAVYVVQGAANIGGTTLATGQMAVLDAVDVSLDAPVDARLMLLGGERFATPRHVYWNFVASSRERIEQAKERWRRREFAAVPNETEFIPLPL